MLFRFRTASLRARASLLFPGVSELQSSSLLFLRIRLLLKKVMAMSIVQLGAVLNVAVWKRQFISECFCFSDTVKKKSLNIFNCYVAELSELKVGLGIKKVCTVTISSA